MVTSALLQLLNGTNWQQLDYLIVDLPPGTGDIQLTLVQKVPLTAAVIITTPQDIALLDAKKALMMFNKVDVPVLGIIENMSTHICSSCGHTEAIFGSDGGAKMAEKYNVPLLGKIPLSRTLRADADIGIPTVVADPKNKISVIYQQIAHKLAYGLSQQTVQKRAVLPKVVVA